jgi:ATP-dependent Zn protease
MTIEDRRGAAYHEAGHIVVAWAVGWKARAAVIGIDGDDAKGKTDLDRDKPLSLVDKIAVCAAGWESQHVFQAPTNWRSGQMDEYEIIELTKNLDEQSRSALRNHGYQRARDLIKTHSKRVAHIAEKLLATGSLNQADIDALLE